MPVRYPRVLIVDAPSTTRNVIYDFNDDTQSLAGGSKTELSAAQWEFGSIDLLGDPDAIGVEYSLQRIAFQQTVTGGKPAAMGRLVQHARALSGRRFWLEFQLTAATAPVWWHAYRSAPSDLSIESVYVAESGPRDRWVLNGGVDVDAFSYSARVNLPSQTVGNNPASSNPNLGYNLPTVKGDAPANLRVAVVSNATSTFSQTFLVACVASARANPVLRVPVGTGDGFTAGDGTGAPTSTSGVGGSSRVVTLAGNAASAMRLSGMFPASAAPAGRYSVYLRCAARRNTTTTENLVFTMQLAAPPSAINTGYSPLSSVRRVSLPSLSGAQDIYSYVPLGDISIGEGVSAGLSGPTQRSVSLLVGGGNVGMTANVALTLDDFILVPVSGRDVSSVTSLIVQSAGVTANPSNPFYCDGDTELSWVGGRDPSTYKVLTSGAWPKVDPAAAYNTLLVLPLEDLVGPSDSAGQTRATDLAATATVDVSLHPRSAWLGDGT